MSTSELPLEQFPLHTIVKGSVQHVTGAGVIVRISPTITGYIPRRELTWEETEEPLRLVRAGQQIAALVTGEDALSGHVLLSHRLALYDPWRNVTAQYPLHSVHSAKVEEQLEYGVFVELEPGIVGLVHNSELPRQGSNGELITLWPDDQVLVEVLAVDFKVRRISLSMRTVITTRARHLLKEDLAPTRLGTTIAERLEAQSDPTTERVLPRSGPDGSIHRVLIVDNEAEFAESLSEIIGGLGYDATYVTTASEAKKLIGDPRYQLLLLDYDMPDSNGFELARLAREQNPSVHLVLLSAQAGPYICQSQIGIPGLICWRKPLRSQEFNDLIAAVTSGTCPLCKDLTGSAVSSEHQPLLFRSSAPTLAKIEDMCRNELAYAMTNTEAEAGVVCGIEEGSRRVRILAQQDPLKLLHRYNLQQLKYSPVSDIIEREKTIRTADVTTRPTRFRHLTPWGTFRAFLGVPVRSESNSLHLGILLFHRSPNHFSAYHEQQALLSAGYLGLARQRQDVLRTTLSAQQAIMTGRIHLALAHEVQKKVGTLQNQVETLSGRVATLHKKGLSNFTPVQEVELASMTVGLRRTLDELSVILERQLDFSRPYEVRTFDLNSIIKRTFEVLRPMAQKVTPAIRLNSKELDPDLPRIESEENLIHQIILNLTLNAIQQMIEMGSAGGELLARTQYVPDASQPVRILFSDWGPGIHAAHQKQLFKQGFTTRTGGTGLGLYISRAAAEALGGRLTLKESYMGYGSTFALELPISSVRSANA